MTHPITPPTELMQAWAAFVEKYGIADVFTTAAQWGADQELEACCEWLGSGGYAGTCFTLRAARRPKPPSLKQQALKAFDQVEVIWATDEFGKETNDALDTIHRALEALPE